ncbi:phosphotransferase [Nocardioides mangrovicus]|uniref:Phosphotransferase n=1 Tax=Nocardioides mangrovicus TaxID=2478913 RepID=A0A3L8P2I1_9ACTN|nr:phosphotransferase [Nocardioides mangrovicus]
MWEPQPGWVPVHSGPAGSVWAVDDDVVVKRLSAPARGDAAALARPDHPAYWRREADVALASELADCAGLRPPPTVRVEEDESGVTLFSRRVATEPAAGPFLARALGTLAAQPLTVQPWWARAVLGTRLEARDGWPTLARTTLADVCDRLWTRRGHHLRAVADLPQVPSHGDPTPANLPGRADGSVVAVDWAAFGAAPLGSDVGYLSLSVREDLDVLLDAYVDAAGCDPDQARLGATVMACYTALTRTEWALARVATGPGALAGKYRHPAVAPYIRSLQRLFPQLESLL